MGLQKAFKDSEYKGFKIKFFKGFGGTIFSQAPERTSQYIGSGKNKTEAFNSAKKVINRAIASGHFKPIKK